MFARIIEKSVRLLASAVLAAAVVGSLVVLVVATTGASDHRNGWTTGQVNRDAVPVAGIAHATPADGLPSFLLRRDGRLRNGLMPNPLTYG